MSFFHNSNSYSRTNKSSKLYLDTLSPKEPAQFTQPYLKNTVIPSSSHTTSSKSFTNTNDSRTYEQADLSSGSYHRKEYPISSYYTMKTTEQPLKQEKEQEINAKSSVVRSKSTTLSQKALSPSMKTLGEKNNLLKRSLKSLKSLFKRDKQRSNSEESTLYQSSSGLTHEVSYHDMDSIRSEKNPDTFLVFCYDFMDPRMSFDQLGGVCDSRL